MPGCGGDAAGPRAIDAIGRFHLAYLRRHGASASVERRKALQSILTCRTEAMGGRSYRCEHCERDHFAWHSCNHRLCPVCGGADTAEWVASRLEGRLPVPHYLVTFTLPGRLRELCRRSADAFLRLFFSSAAKAIKDVLKDQRHLGGDCGFFGMLQTWTQDLRLHPHIHFVVPAVGLDAKGKLKRPRKANWLARGDVFARRLQTLLLGSLRDEGLLGESEIQSLWRTGWNCDVENFGSGENAIKYLGAYVCKGPISDSRILAIDAETVTISVKDRESGERRAVRIDGAEFVRRYLQHALPQGFHAVRYYGFLHPRAQAKLATIRESWEAQRATRETMLLLRGHGVGPVIAERIQAAFGVDTGRVLDEDPYRIARDVDGVGFLTADRLARALGLAASDPRRLRGGLLHTAREALDQGHTAVPRAELLDRAAAALGPGAAPGELEDALLTARQAGELELDAPAGEDVVYLPAILRAERQAALRAAELAAAPAQARPLAEVEPEEALAWVAGQAGVELSPDQALAVRAVLAAPVVVITGGPGVGKTTVVRALVHLFRRHRLLVGVQIFGVQIVGVQIALGRVARSVQG